MGCACAPALKVARDELNALFPNRDKGSDGCCGDADHAARKSDHNPLNGYARAFDYDEDIVDGMGDQELQGMALVLLADSRTKYLIYEAQLLYPDGTVKPYTGVNAHRQHLHHSIKDSAVHDTRPWGIARAFQEDDMSAQAEADIRSMKDLLEKHLAPAIGRIDARTAASTDPKAFAAQVAVHLDGVTEDDVERAFRNVLTEGVG